MALAHEDLHSREMEATGSTNRNFGLVFAGVFLIVCLWPLRHGLPARWWAAGVSAAFFLLALALPAVLAPLNRVWTAFGLLLAKITQPVFLAILFYGVFTPFGFLLRLFGTKLLPLRWDPAASSYWIPRDPPGPAPESMKNQF